ncbi:hypothetical protein AOA57_29390 [Pseudomonas sp. 2588-5]|jgi:hypothetical protein|nr:hypothetical protein AOA57_29390 [Pseudomonas sp. 2588-5]
MKERKADHRQERASVGWLVSSSFEGDINTKDVNYRQSPDDLTLYGIQQTDSDNFIGIQINFPVNIRTGLHELPSRTIYVAYFRQSGQHRTRFNAKSGELFLTKWDDPNAHAEGKFRFTAAVDDTDHSFDGSFSIRWDGAGKT